jgi:hypothetical protein
MNPSIELFTIKRIPELGPKEFERLKKYHKAYRYLIKLDIVAWNT